MCLLRSDGRYKKCVCEHIVIGLMCIVAKFVFNDHLVLV